MFNIPSLIMKLLEMMPTNDPTKTENYNAIHELYRTLPRLPPSSLRPNWSCDWESYQDIYMFLVKPEYYDLSYIDMTMSCFYDLPVPIRPIAYNKGSYDHSFVFEAGGRYYMYLTAAEQLSRFEVEGLTDENAVSVGVGSKYEILDEAEDGGIKLYDLEQEQRRMEAFRVARSGLGGLEA